MRVKNRNANIKFNAYEAKKIHSKVFDPDGKPQHERLFDDSTNAKGFQKKSAEISCAEAAEPEPKNRKIIFLILQSRLRFCESGIFTQNFHPWNQRFAGLSNITG